MKNGERVKACCQNCRFGHHAWNPGCPARHTAFGNPSYSQDVLQAVLLEFSEGFAELLGVSVRRDKLYALVKRACSKLAALQLTPRPVLLREKALPDTPPLPRRREVQEASCGVPPKRRRRRNGRKKPRPPPPLVPRLPLLRCAVWGPKLLLRAAAWGPRLLLFVAAVWRHRRPSHQHQRGCHHHHLLLGVNPHLPAAAKRPSLTERRPRTWTSPKRRGARLLQQRRYWTQGLYIPGRLMGVARPDSPPKRDVKCTSNSVSCLSRQKTSTVKQRVKTYLVGKDIALVGSKFNSEKECNEENVTELSFSSLNASIYI
ncbi:hypothetical protein Pmani_026628 [Petrolisthes manimaculis]|uniref:Uncharacterized protein n=1 Tax=Petrolisthes manimaculis TaxID=1843537 RepID=A0AAE1P5S8_9EUCA|nr:hypothetical protein Pmani_026628 [Petrolisthes manimaculis]